MCAVSPRTFACVRLQSEPAKPGSHTHRVRQPALVAALQLAGKAVHAPWPLQGTGELQEGRGAGGATDDRVRPATWQ